MPRVPARARDRAPELRRQFGERVRTLRLAAGFSQDLPIPFYYERRGRFVRELL